MKSMESVWSKQTQFPERKALAEDIEVDVAVIGAGMAGILTAYFLKEKGFRVALLEANTVASGMTKNTTAKITSQHGLIYNRLIVEVGEKKARQYAVANQLAIEKYAELVKKLEIQCNFERKNNYVYTLDNVKRIKDELRAAQSLDIDAGFVEQLPLPISIKGAVCLYNQAQFNPLQFLAPIAQDLQIYEHTMVREIKDDIIITDNAKVAANKIVFATHFPFINSPGFYFARMHQQRSYVVAYENAAQVDGMYIDADDNSGYSFRNYEDLLLIGGAGHRTGQHEKGGSYLELRTKAKEWYPNATERYHWSAQDCMPMDGVPYIGQYAPTTPNWFVATGFQKWGMTSSMVSAMVITDLISEENSKFAEVFTPLRFNVSASIENLVKDTGKAVSGLMKQGLLIPKTTLDQLPNGHGGVVEHEGNKVGVYKNQEGKTFLVSTQCPHLGCQLAWNPDELTWDCPCHGSRFDYEGNLIDNPATKNLSTE